MGYCLLAKTTAELDFQTTIGLQTCPVCKTFLTLSMAHNNYSGVDLAAKCAKGLFRRPMVPFVLAIFDTSPLLLTNHTAG